MNIETARLQDLHRKNKALAAELARLQALVGNDEDFQSIEQVLKENTDER